MSLSNMTDTALLNRGIVIPYTLVATQEAIFNANNISGTMYPPPHLHLLTI